MYLLSSYCKTSLLKLHPWFSGAPLVKKMLCSCLIHLRFTLLLLLHLHLISTPPSTRSSPSEGDPPTFCLTFCFHTSAPHRVQQLQHFPFRSCVPLPHSKRCIPSEPDCYYGNCSNKNKHPLAEFDLSGIHKFVNKRPDKE